MDENQAPSAESDFSQVIEQAMAWQREGRIDEAIAVYRSVLDHSPQHPDALHYLGLALRSRGDWEGAMESMEQALEADPDYIEALNNLGVTYQYLGQLEKAEACYRRAISARPTHADSHNNLGVLLKGQGRMRDAGAAFMEALAADPWHGRAHHNLGNLYRMAGHMEEAIDHFRSALRGGVAATEARQTLIKALHLSGKTEEAREALDEWLEIDPGNPIALHKRAALKLDPTPDRAADDYVKVIFDNLSDSFDRHLAKLRYRAPEFVRAALDTSLSGDAGPFDILDSGCGTGLCGNFLRPVASRLVGVDLSGGMLEKASATGLYDELAEEELTAYLESHPGTFDIVVCTDTLCYFGDLQPVSAATFRALRPGGRYVFTVERRETDEPAGFQLLHNGRYSHDQDYVVRTLEDVGLQIESLSIEPLRQEENQDVNGLVICARRPGQPA